ncbi:DUF423 domain-containing protein [Sporolactobacillus terrae]|uniref:DUF423 domain-containing protein n=1 Tax=Sporolactobacillus terrae TaxID=269673 RepID=A0A410DC98_9BACL|nr:DUF423 domain-containing protein [Sporolactobacillus terrae]QAA23714.1 DUF423 domain-containing protein [Sporolactobacillus terrae]QAA26686.1 DUF423 domain-containing protein [Sporolactobacillus terrae]UAK15754.1 DUF423 domain-containing protein [Sporolactobacillus terrae]BBO00243.1 UPF0382 membrane protein [Sporolactobacillus terrae]
MKVFIAIGAILAFLSVTFGAFGAHVLKARLTEQNLSIFQTGVQYQMVHALGLILIGILALTVFTGQTTLLAWAGWLMTLGVVLFSGSLYALTLSGVRVLGAITPIGGVLFLISWVLVVAAVLRA